MDDREDVEAGALISEPDPIRTHAHRDTLTLVEPRPFGAYTLVAKLGRGGTGDVFLALSARTAGFQKLLVLKVLHEVLEQDLEALEMFLDEARIAARLQHPNVVQTFEVGESEGRHYIAMEYAAGMGLDHILTDCRARGRLLPIDFCARVAAEVLAGLSYAHDRADLDGEPLEIVHRDVSPANILVGWDGTVKVVDFGISMARTTGDPLESGVIRGRLAYMAPEQAEGGPVDPRADVFSLGVVLWEMLTGTRLFRSATSPSAVAKEPIPQVIDVRPEVPQVLSDIVAMALQRDRAERYPSADLMRHDLEDFLSRRGELTRDDIAATLGDYFEGERERQNLLLNESVGGLPLTATHTGSFAVPPQPELEAAPEPPPAPPAKAKVPLAPIALAVLVIVTLVAVALTRGPSRAAAPVPSAAAAPAGMVAPHTPSPAR